MKPKARFTYTGTAQDVSAGGPILFNSVKADSGIAYNGNGGIQIRYPGTYEVDVSVTTVATAAGTDVVQLYEGLNAVQGASGSNEASAIGDYSCISFSDLVTVVPASNGYATLYVNCPNATSISNAIVVVK